MSLIYTFSFAPPAAGLTCTITDQTGTVVHTGTVGTSTGRDGAVKLSVPLEEGDYVGSVSDLPFGEWHDVGSIDVPDSFSAAGGGAMSTDDTEYYVETDPPQTPPSWNTTHIIDWTAGDWDADGTVVSLNQIFLASSGVYGVAVLVRFAAPEQLTSVYLRAGSALIGGNGILLPGAVSTVQISGVLRVDAETPVSGPLVTLSAGDAVDPVIPAIQFAYISFKKLVDAA